MSASAMVPRRVKRLHLVAPDATLHGRGVRLIEDAMRTASLPDGHARVTVIRRFALPRFGAGISPQALALALERHITALARDAVHAADAAAPAASAVWFRDALEAHILLAVRIAESASGREWFWPLAIPQVAAANGTHERLRAVVLAVSRLPEARAALPPFVRALAAQGLARKLFECLHDSDVSHLIAAAGLRADCAIPPAPLPRTTSGTAPHPAPAPIAGSIGCDGYSLRDPRARFVAALLAPVEVAQHSRVAARERALAADSESRASPGGSLERAYAGDGERRAAPAAPARDEAAAPERKVTAMPPIADASASPSATPDRLLRGSAHTPARGARKRDDALMPRTRARGLTPVGTREQTTIEQAPWPSGAPTAAGGLLFLIAVLERVGFARWLDGAPAWQWLAIERRVFARVCASLRVPPDDPVWAITCRDDSVREPLVDAVTRAWLGACRRWLWRGARTSLAALVLRPARVSFTPTHVDVEFALSGVSIEVRCAGLDIDRGWVPWFGRVVAFHYGKGLEPWT